MGTERPGIACGAAGHLKWLLERSGGPLGWRGTVAVGFAEAAQEHVFRILGIGYNGPPVRTSGPNLQISDGRSFPLGEKF